MVLVGHGRVVDHFRVANLPLARLLKDATGVQRFRV